MSKLLTNTTDLQDVLEALQNKASGGSSEITLQEKTVSPTTSQQIVTADDGYDGLSAVTVAGDSNLIASNIKSGVTIFGITGTYTGDNVTLITFTILEKEYQAEEGMTWEEWVNSEYNTDGYYMYPDSEEILYPGGVVCLNDFIENKTNTILNGQNYTVSQGGVGDRGDDY